ncbi:MAG: alkaline phosphatase family protein [Bacteroidaceae bacterium]|nr:alkaline phosphatase family protein [Bacteroidaceae bacterium]
MRKELLATILVLTIGGWQMQKASAQPRLVVSLTIDQLRTDYMEAYIPHYGQQGFKRLLRDGKVYKQVGFSFQASDRASAMAAIYTGTTPSVNGIIGNEWLDRETGRPRNCVDDTAFMGNNTNENTSAAQLLSSTLPDELKIATKGEAQVYAIAPFRDAAIMSAGHAANCAFWINPETGKWCSTTYYKDFPWWLDEFNSQQGPDLRVKDKDRVNRYRRLLTSPSVNEEVNYLTEELLTKSDMGKDEVTDFLALTYYAGTYQHLPLQESYQELQAVYIGIDSCIERLLDTLEHKVGLSHVLFCISSTGFTDPVYQDLTPYNIPTGEFYLNRCATLLNMFLMATYGEGEYVEHYFNQQIFLNHKLIENKHLDMAEVQQKASEFLVQFSGVNEVYSANRLLLAPYTERTERSRNGYHRKRSGDLIVEVLPGWQVVNEQTQEKKIVSEAVTPIPFIILHPVFKAESISTPVVAERIAPTIANAIHIRAPNGCSQLPLEE